MLMAYSPGLRREKASRLVGARRQRINGIKLEKMLVPDTYLVNHILVLSDVLVFDTEAVSSSIMANSSIPLCIVPWHPDTDIGRHEFHRLL